MKELVTPKKQHQLMYDLEKNHFWFKALRENEYYFIKEIFKNKENKEIKILDIGCGAGYLIYDLKQKGFNVKGIDYSENAIELCEQRGLVKDEDVFNMDIFNLLFPDESFDCIILNDVLFAFELEEASLVVEKIAKLLSKDGIFIGQTASFQFLYSQSDIVAGTKHRYTKDEILNIFKNNNLKILKLCYRNFLLFIPLLISRFMIKKKVRRSDAKSGLSKPSPIINLMMYLILKLDNFILRYIDFFVGGTVFWIVKKGEKGNNV